MLKSTSYDGVRFWRRDAKADGEPFHDVPLRDPRMRCHVGATSGVA